MDRRNFCKVSLTFAASAGLKFSPHIEAGSTQQSLNFVVIINDQHNSKLMNWTGMGDGVKTPNIDRLASESVVFTNAYSNCPICAPARHCMYTGRYASGHGVLYNDCHLREDIPTMMEILSQNGYTTANVGKMHFGPYNMRRGFDYVVNHEFFVDSAGISHFRPYLDREIQKRGITAQRYPVWQDQDEKAPWNLRPENIAFKWDITKDLSSEHFVSDQSIAFLEDQTNNRPDQPFFLHSSYFGPHHPYAPAKEFDIYKPEDMVLPPNFSTQGAEEFYASQREEYDIPAYTEEDFKYMKAKYLGYITQVDFEIGRLLDYIDNNPQIADNTVVLFLSDHGDRMAEHGMLYKGDKGGMYDGSAAVPFMFRFPGTASRQECSPVSDIDIMPTILNAAGIEIPQDLPGDDLQPLVKASHANDYWKNRTVFSEWFWPFPWGYIMARRGKYKLIADNYDNTNQPRDQFPDFKYELYDMENDMWELSNLADNQEYQSVLDNLKNEIQQHWQRQNPKLPDKRPTKVSRSKWDIDWPADPWKKVKAEG